MVIIRCPITIRRLCFLQAIEGVNVQTAKRYVAAGVGHYISFFAFPSSGSVILFQTELCTGQNLVWRAGVLDDGQAVGVEVDTGSSSRTGSKAGVALLVLPLTIQRCSVLKGEGIAFNQTFRINSVMENQHKRGAIGYLCPCLKLVAVIAAVLEIVGGRVNVISGYTGKVCTPCGCFQRTICLQLGIKNRDAFQRYTLVTRPISPQIRGHGHDVLQIHVGAIVQRCTVGVQLDLIGQKTGGFVKSTALANNSARNCFGKGGITLSFQMSVHLGSSVVS